MPRSICWARKANLYVVSVMVFFVVVFLVIVFFAGFFVVIALCEFVLFRFLLCPGWGSSNRYTPGASVIKFLRRNVIRFMSSLPMECSTCFAHSRKPNTCVLSCFGFFKFSCSFQSRNFPHPSEYRIVSCPFCFNAARKLAMYSALSSTTSADLCNRKTKWSRTCPRAVRCDPGTSGWSAAQMKSMRCRAI